MKDIGDYGSISGGKITAWFEVSKHMVDDTQLQIVVTGTFKAGTPVSYAIYDDSEGSGLVLFGSDLSCAAMLDATPLEMAVSLAGFLSAYAEHMDSLYTDRGYGCDHPSCDICPQFTPEQREWVCMNAERLSNWTVEVEMGNIDD